MTHPIKKQVFPSEYGLNQEMLDLLASIDLSGFTVHKGRVVSSNSFPAPQELFASIKHKNPLCIDMETSALYQAAWFLKKTKIIAFRAVSNCLNAEGKDEHIAEVNLKASLNAASQSLLKLLEAILAKMENNLPLERPQELECTHHQRAKDLIRLFNLQTHPEGGYFAQTYKSNSVVKPQGTDRYKDEERSAGSLIYYLLNEDDFSAWHRLKSDEIWHHYEGSLLKIYVIDKTGQLSTYLLGNPMENPGASFQVLVPQGAWFCAELVNKKSYALVGCTVNPGFEEKDFELAKRDRLSREYPQHQKIIQQFTRDLPQEAPCLDIKARL